MTDQEGQMAGKDVMLQEYRQLCVEYDRMSQVRYPASRRAIAREIDRLERLVLEE